MPDVAMVVTTYMPSGAIGRRRMGATLDAVESWNVGFHVGVGYPGVRYLDYVFADDGSDIAHLEEFTVQLNHRIGKRWLNTCTDRLGCAGALHSGIRVALQSTEASVIGYAQDDWTCDSPLDLAPSLALLNADTADIVRLGPTHPNLTGHVVRTAIPGAEWCLEYCWEGGGYVVGWRPALYHRRVFERFPLDGLEGLSAIEGERVWLERMAADPNPPRVFHAPNCTLAGPFRHIDTIELGEDDPATLTERYA